MAPRAPKAKKVAAPKVEEPKAEETEQEAMLPREDKTLEEDVRDQLEAYFEKMPTQDPKPPPTHIPTP